MDFDPFHKLGITVALAFATFAGMTFYIESQEVPPPPRDGCITKREVSDILIDQTNAILDSLERESGHKFSHENRLGIQSLMISKLQSTIASNVPIADSIDECR